MKLIVFGATGGTGRQVVAQALAAGHTVTAVARRPATMTTHHERLEVIQGDVLEPSTIEQLIVGKDAVVSAVGVATRAPTTVYSAGMANIVRAMRAAGVHRLTCISSGGLDADRSDVPLPQRLVTKFVVQRVYRHPFADMARMEAVLANSALDWTVIRAPMLTDGPRTGRYRTAVHVRLPRPEKISRADLADYILTHLADPVSHGAHIEISY